MDDKTPAFPNALVGQAHPGMSLRDYFAAKAMQAIVAQFDNEEDPAESVHRIGAVAYLIADQMLRARSQ